MVGKVEYLSKQEAASISIEVPQDLNCDAIDLSQLSQNPMEVLDLQESKRRLREMTQESCNEQVRLGRCEFCYSELSQGDAFSGIKPWGLIVSSFSNLKLDFSNFKDLSMPLTTAPISIRRLQETKTYRFEHDGLPCVFIHGAGVQTDTDELVDRFDSYWGRGSRLDMPPYCSRVIYVKMDFKKVAQASRLAELLKEVRYSKIPTQEIKKMILITHGIGGFYLSKALQQGLLVMHRTVRWLGLNVPQTTPHVLELMTNDNCNKNFEWLIKTAARESQSKLDMTCNRMSRNDWTPPSNKIGPFYKFELSAGLCGIVASHKENIQKKILNHLKTPETEGLAMKTLTDGVNRIDHCLILSGNSVLSKFDVLKTNYWDSQMRKADGIKRGGVRYWLHNTATKALEALVNGKTPDLQGAEDSILERMYEKAAARRAERQNVIQGS